MNSWFRRLILGAAIGAATLPQAHIVTDQRVLEDREHEQEIASIRKTNEEFVEVLKLAKKANITLESHDRAWLLRQLPSEVRDEYTTNRGVGSTPMNIESASLSVCVEAMKAYNRFMENPTFENAEVYLGFVQLAREVTPAAPLVMNFMNASRSVVHQAIRANNK